MLPPLIQRPRRSANCQSRERGVTLVLVAAAMVAVISMAALSIDIGTLYEAKAEAQRAADAAALTAARVISISGITGDPGNTTSSWQPICGGSSSYATLAAIKVVQQNLIAGISIPSTDVSVNYGAGSAGGPNANCVGLAAAFGVNPVVTVNVQRTKLPVFFAHVFSLFGSSFSSTSVSATATAEAFNPSNSGSIASNMIPVQPRCVKPWIVPNSDPDNPAPGQPFVSPVDGSIINPGVSLLGQGVIGESFNLNADCKPGRANCHGPNMFPDRPTPKWNGTYLEYVPALVSGNPGAAPACANANTFQEAIGGCDQTTAYTCGTPSTTAGATQADLNLNPVNPTAVGGDTGTAAECLTNQLSGGHDILDTATFPFQIRAGSGSPLTLPGVGVNSGDVVTTSSSIVTVPIYDGAALVGRTPPVTIVGFLQVFINNIDPVGNVNVTVLNVAGCSNNAAGNPVFGTSPVPVRLITAP